MTIKEIKKINRLLKQREVAIKFFCTPKLNVSVRNWLADRIDEYTVQLKELGLEES